MSTWTCRLVLIAGLGLTGCSELSEGFGLGVAQGKAKEPVTHTVLGAGQVHLVAPDGYCIDRNSVRDRFALMARCDTLGGQNIDVPLAIITASLAEVDDLETPEPKALVTPQESVLGETAAGHLQMVSVAGSPPAAGLSERYWRGAGPLGPYMMGLAVYAPDTQTPADAMAQDLITTTYDRSQTRSLTEAIRYEAHATSTVPADDAKATGAKNPLKGVFVRLFQ